MAMPNVLNFAMTGCLDFRGNMIFRVVSAALEKSTSMKGTTTSLHFKVVLEGSRDTIELETGEVLRDPWSYTNSSIEAENPEVSLGVYRDGLGRAKIDEGEDRIGTMLYYSASDHAFSELRPSMIHVRFYLDDTEYGRLLIAVSRGVIPKRFMVSTTRGIEYGGIEGERMKWKNKECGELPLEHVSWVITTDAPERAASAQETEAEKSTLSILTDIRALLVSLRWFAVGAFVVYVASLWWKR